VYGRGGGGCGIGFPAARLTLPCTKRERGGGPCKGQCVSPGGGGRGAHAGAGSYRAATKVRPTPFTPLLHHNETSCPLPPTPTHCICSAWEESLMALTAGEGWACVRKRRSSSLNQRNGDQQARRPNSKTNTERISAVVQQRITPCKHAPWQRAWASFAAAPAPPAGFPAAKQPPYAILSFPVPVTILDS
jgi:hypothetical protein